MVSTDVRWLWDVFLFLEWHTHTPTAFLSENHKSPKSHKHKDEWEVFYLNYCNLSNVPSSPLSPVLPSLSRLQCFRTFCCKGPPPPRPEYDVVCIGLTGSGKTSLLSRLCSEATDNIVPTTGQPTIIELYQTRPANTNTDLCTSSLPNALKTPPLCIQILPCDCLLKSTWLNLGQCSNAGVFVKSSWPLLLILFNFYLQVLALKLSRSRMPF